ncbi:MrcB family domain-containing protein [Bacillus paranthracis]|uniref:MrcB family domain-containing protein n=2 Tax=Bacillus paranthracis TaxID=2026186 RepID=UPI002E1CDD5B
MNSNLREKFLAVMDEYLQARTERFAGHKMGSVFRYEMTTEITRLPSIEHSQYIVTGSVGQENLDEASSIKSYYVQDVQIWVDYENDVVRVGRDGRVKEVPLELVVGRESVLFREALEVLNVWE